MGVIPPSIGQMRAIVKFERNEPTTLGAGRKDNYVEWFNTRGQLAYKTGQRIDSHGNAVIYGRWVLKCRMQAELENFVSKSNRIVINNRIFTVANYSLIDQKRFYYEFNLNDQE